MVTIYTLIRRNLIVLEENSRYISFWTIFAFIDTLLISPMTLIHIIKVLLLFAQGPFIRPQFAQVMYIRRKRQCWKSDFFPNFWSSLPTTCLLSFLFIDIFHGVVIPLRMVIPWKTEQKEKPAEESFPDMSKRIPLKPRRNAVKVSLPEKTSFPATPPPSPLPKTEKWVICILMLCIYKVRDALLKIECFLMGIAQITFPSFPPPPNSGNLYKFFRTSEFEIWKSV